MADKAPLTGTTALVTRASNGIGGATDIAEAIGSMVTRPRRMAVNEILVRPTEQDQ